MPSFHRSRTIRLLFFSLFCFGQASHLLIAQVATVKPWDENPKAYVQEKAVQASADQMVIQDSLKKEKQKLAILENTLARTTQAPKVASLKSDIKFSKTQVKNLQDQLADKIQEGKMYKDMSSMSEQEIRVKLRNTRVPTAPAPVKTESAAVNTTAKPSLPSTTETKTAPVTQPATEKITSQSFDPWSGKEYSGVYIKQTCQFQDNNTSSNNKSGAALQPEVLFRYTPEEIKKYLKGQNYVTGTAFIAAEPGYTYLQLRLDIASDQALRHYGNLEKSILTIFFVNGKELKIVNSRFDQGFVDNLRKSTTMTGVYYLEKSMIKMLGSSEIDKIRLNFATGYEDYVVYNIDFFTRQLACINASK